MRETYLGVHGYLGIKNRPQAYSLPAGVRVSLLVERGREPTATSSAATGTGGTSLDLSNPNDWEAPLSPYATWAPPRSFSSGVHTLFVEAVDNNGYSTLAQIEISIFPRI